MSNESSTLYESYESICEILEQYGLTQTNFHKNLYDQCIDIETMLVLNESKYTPTAKHTIYYNKYALSSHNQEHNQDDLSSTSSYQDSKFIIAYENICKILECYNELQSDLHMMFYVSCVDIETEVMSRCHKLEMTNYINKSKFAFKTSEVLDYDRKLNFASIMLLFAVMFIAIYIMY